MVVTFCQLHKAGLGSQTSPGICALHDAPCFTLTLWTMRAIISLLALILGAFGNGIKSFSCILTVVPSQSLSLASALAIINQVQTT